MTQILIFIIGLILGSFLSVIFTRVEIEGLSRGKAKSGSNRRALRDVLVGRSRCDHCKKTIPWYDNVPLISFFLLKGKCRHCGKLISGYHPLLELSSGLFLLATYQAFGWSWQFVLAGFFGLVLLLLFAYDLRHQLIPNVIVLPAIILALVLIFVQLILSLADSNTLIGIFDFHPVYALIGGVALGGFFLVMSLLSKGTWIGGGDIKLGFLIGLLLGWPNVVVAMVLAYFIGAGYALILLLTKQANLKSSVAFGPFMVMGFLIALFYAESIIHWYGGWFT